jgi:hypothetical protein
VEIQRENKILAEEFGPEENKNWAKIRDERIWAEGFDFQILV